MACCRERTGSTLVLTFADTAHNLLLGGNGFGGRELPRRSVFPPVPRLKFPGSKPGIEIGADLGVGDFAHAAPEAVAHQGALVDDRFALEVLVTGKGQRFLRAIVWDGWLDLVLNPFPRRADDGIGLIAELGGQPPMGVEHFLGRQNLLLVACGVSGDLRGLRGPRTPLRSMYSRICWLRGLEASRYSCE